MIIRNAGGTWGNGHEPHNSNLWHSYGISVCQLVNPTGHTLNLSQADLIGNNITEEWESTRRGNQVDSESKGPLMYESKSHLRAWATPWRAGPTWRVLLPFWFGCSRRRTVRLSVCFSSVSVWDLTARRGKLNETSEFTFIRRIKANILCCQQERKEHTQTGNINKGV